jgi:hypothetical protein
MVREVVLAGNAPLKAAMTLIEPVTIGELPELLVANVREALDVIMDVTEQRTQQAIAGLSRPHLLSRSTQPLLLAHKQGLDRSPAKIACRNFLAAAYDCRRLGV